MDENEEQGSETANAEEAGVVLDSADMSAITGRLGLQGLVAPPPNADGTPKPEDGRQDDGEQDSTENDDGQKAGEDNGGAEPPPDDADGEGDNHEDDDQDGLSKAKLSPAQQAAVNKRIGKEVARRKALEEQLQAANGRVESLAQQAESLRGQLRGGAAGSVTADGVHPLYMVEDESELDKREQQIMQFRQWARKNRNGVEPSEDGKQPGYTAEQIADRLEELEDEARFVIPKVRDMLAKRRQVDAYTRKVYPELFDAKHEAKIVLEQALIAIPSLRRYPNAALMIGDMLAGGRARLEKEAAAAGKGKAGQTQATPKPPRTPTPPQGGGKSVPKAQDGKKQPAGPSAERFAERGAGREALEAEAKNIMAGLGY